MVECAMTQDIFKRKSKFIANFSPREIVFGFTGLILGGMSYFLWFSKLNDNLRIFLTFVIVLPFFLIGFVKIYEQPFEKIAPSLVIDNFLCPKYLKKEVHFKNFEKYESKRYWMLEKEKQEEEKEQIENQENEEELNNKKKKKKNNFKSKSKNNQKTKIIIAKSEVYRAIK